MKNRFNQVPVVCWHSGGGSPSVVRRWLAWGTLPEPNRLIQRYDNLHYRSWQGVDLKQWPSSHPKAALLSRKRASILDAARSTFLKDGYEGARMEAIATAAGVSIMTLYRHARSKDELFAAVMLNECERAHSSQEADELLPCRTPRDLLIQAGIRFQERLIDSDIISLFKTVMVETVRFPNVAKAAYGGFVDSWQREIVEFTAGNVEFAQADPAGRTEAVRLYIDDLIGSDLLRALFAMPSQMTPELRKQRAETAADRLINNLVIFHSTSAKKIR